MTHWRTLASEKRKPHNMPQFGTCNRIATCMYRAKRKTPVIITEPCGINTVPLLGWTPFGSPQHILHKRPIAALRFSEIWLIEFLSLLLQLHFTIIKIYTIMKTVFTWRQLLLLLILPSCVSCVGGFIEEDKETQENHSKLLGVWEPIYQYDYGWFQYPGSDIQTYSEAYPITEELVDEYNVYRFNSNTVSIIATSDPDIKDILGVPCAYSLDKDVLSGRFFWGDFVQHVYIDFHGDDFMRIRMVDVGQGTTLEGDYCEEYEYYNGTTIFRRIADADWKTVKTKYTIKDLLYWFYLPPPTKDTENKPEEEDTPPDTVTIVFPGHWETIKYEETHIETCTKDGKVEVVRNEVVPEFDVTTEDDVYHVVRMFNGYATIKIAKEKYEKKLNKAYPYRVDEGKLECELFEGEYTEYVTVEYPETDVMVLTLNDKGSYTDDSGCTYAKNIVTTTTYHRIN